MRCYLLFILLGVSVLFADTTITLGDTAVVTSKYIRFGEIVGIRGDYAEEIGRAILAPAPANDEQLVVTRQQILQRLQTLGWARRVNFAGSEKVSIATKNMVAPTTLTNANVSSLLNGATLTDNKLVLKTVALNNVASPRESGRRDDAARRERKFPAAVEQAARSAIEQLITREFAGYQIEAQLNLRRVDLNYENVTRMEATKINDGRLPGRAEFAITAYNAQNEIVDYGTIEAQASLKISTPVLRRSLRKGEILRTGDLALQFEPFNGTRPEKFNFEELNGHECLRALTAGSKISSADFIPPQDTKKGAVVNVIVRGNGFTIKERAIAQEAGRIGEQIKVQAEISKNIYTVRLTGNGTADLK